jgi:hypothetical protein
MDAVKHQQFIEGDRGLSVNFVDAPIAATREYDRAVNEVEASRILGVSRALLKHWRWRKTGPKYSRLGRRIVYKVSDLHAFLDANAA